MDSSSGTVRFTTFWTINQVIASANEFVTVETVTVFTLNASIVSAPVRMIVEDNAFVAKWAGKNLAAVRVAALAARIAAVLADRMIGITEAGQLAGPVLESSAGGLVTAVGAVAPAQAAHSAAGVNIAPLAGVHLAAAAVIRIAEMLRVALTLSVLMLFLAVLADDFGIVPSAVAAVVALDAAAVERMFGTRLAQTAVTVGAGQVRRFDVARIALAHLTAVAALVVEFTVSLVTVVKLAAGTLVVFTFTGVMPILAARALVMLEVHRIAGVMLATAHEAMIGDFACIGAQVEATVRACHVFADFGLPLALSAAFTYGVVKIRGYAHGLAAGRAIVAI